MRCGSSGRRIRGPASFSADELREVDRLVEQCGRRYFADGSSVDRLYAPLRAACDGVRRHSNDQTRFGLFRTAVLIAASDGFVTPASAMPGRRPRSGLASLR